MKSEKKWSKFISWFLTRPRTSGFLVFLILCIVVSFIILQRFHIVKENERQEMNNTLNIVHQNIEQSLKNCYTTTLTLALTINDNGVPENFDYIGAHLVESNTSINAVQLVPNGVIKYIYPMEGNAEAMNLNILKSPSLKDEALKSIETQKMYFAGPIELKQGGIGIVGRLPVYNKNKFWGFSAVIIRLETFLKASGINSVNDEKYYFQISKKNPVTQKEDFFLPFQGNFSKNYYVSTSIPDGDWKLYLISKNQYDLYPQILLPAILGFILALLFGILITTLLKKPAELQLLAHNQAIKLLSSEIKFKTIFDQAAVGIAHIDSYSGNFIEINQQYCNLLGYSYQEMKEKNFQAITHPDDLEKDLASMKKLREGKIREFSMEKRYLTKFGKIIWANLTVSPLWKVNEKATTHISIIEDISLKKEAEELIRKSEAHFKSLFEDSPIALWEEDFSAVKNYLHELKLINEDPETVSLYLNEHPEVVQKCISLVKIIDVNNECLILFSPKTKQELLKSTDVIQGTEVLQSFINQLIAITEGQKQLIMDTKLEGPNGEIRDIHLRWSVMKGYEKTLERVIVSTEDITERKTAEKIILNSQQRIRSLINTIDGIVWECDVETYSFTFISKKVEKILGYTPEEWMASKTFWADHIYPEDKAFAINYCSTKTREKVNHDFEYRMVAKNGSVVWLRDIVNVNIENGETMSLRGIMIDITKTKEAEKIIIDSQHKIETLVNSIDGIVWECDYKTLELTFISKKSEEMLGYTPEEWILDVNFWEKHIHPDDRESTVQTFRNINKENGQKDYEYRMITKDGAVIWIREIINVLFENEQPISLRGIMIDISKTKEAEKDLNNSFDLVTEQNKRLLNFSYIVSHNLRSHTSNIESITTLIESSESEEETKQMVQLLKTVSGSLSETMVNLNDVVNIQTNIGLVSEPLKLKQYIDKIQNILSEQIAIKNAVITTNVTDDVMINYNPAYLESILLNLISNAIRYSHPDRKPVISITWFVENDMKILQISDNGVGIDLKRNGEKIFGMYKTFSNNPDSRGIGLFITKNQIVAMGGDITVESEPNVGTRFKIYIK
ncbi:MAG: PAS domain S-box protein [Flavobacterium sp.]